MFQTARDIFTLQFEYRSLINVQKKIRMRDSFQKKIGMLSHFLLTLCLYIWTNEKLAYPDAGIVFTVCCPEKMTHTPEFRCFWLPQEATDGITDKQGWTKRLFCDEGDSILYCISTFDTVRDGFQLVLSGDVRVVKEERLGDREIIEITSDTSRLISISYDRANYILLFDHSTGYLVLISGEAEMGILEHIALEMEIRESDTPVVEETGGPMIGIMDLARG